MIITTFAEENGRNLLFLTITNLRCIGKNNSVYITKKTIRKKLNRTKRKLKEWKKKKEDMA